MTGGPQTVRDGHRILKFVGTPIAHVSSARPNSPRWTEITVYRLPAGGYMYARVGASLVAHRPGCELASWKAKAWISLDEATESRAQRVPCTRCQPVIEGGMDPQTLVETTQYSAKPAITPGELLGMLMKYVPPEREVPRLIVNAISQVRDSDQEFADYLATPQL